MDEFSSEMSRPWSIGTSSMNAVSFGFLATAILMCLFLVMAIFEHLFTTGPLSLSSPEDQTDINLESGTRHKLGTSLTASISHTVLMPGQQYPTFIAQAAPLPCQRESADWPSHETSLH
nr:multidrug resistance protein [Ipomoea batatas]